MATKDGYWNLFREIRSRGNYSEVLMATLSQLSGELNLDSVKSCLMIGPGDGQHELQFIKQCLPNVSKLIAIEPDHESAERLKARLRQSLSSVDSQVIETNIQSWKGLDDPVDLVLMMLVIHYFRSERKQLFTKLSAQWLTRHGHAVVVSPCRTKCPGNEFEIYSRLGTPMLAWEDVEADLLQVGFIKQHAREMQTTHDLSNLDESFRGFVQYNVDRPITLDDVRSVTEELFPDGKTDQAFLTLAVFQKA